MKKHLVIKAVTSFLFFIFTTSYFLKAQDTAGIKKGRFIIGIGLAAPDVAKPKFVSSKDTTHTMGPFYFKAGYAFSDRNVIGIYGSFTRIAGTVDYNDSMGIEGGGPGIPGYIATIPTSYSYILAIYSCGLEYTHYFGKWKKILPYYGGMLGDTRYRLIIQGYQPYNNMIYEPKDMFTYQVYGGLKWYFVKFLGLDARISYGNTYYANIGLSFKFGGYKTP